MAYKHGVYIQETPTKLIAPVLANSAIQFIVGTAPVNLLDDPSSAVNKIIVLNNFDEAVEKVGYSDSFDKFSLCQAIDASFRIFNVAPIVVVNVLDPSIHKIAVVDELNPLVAREVIIEEEGILLDANFVVKDSTKTTTYTKGTDYTLEFNDMGHVLLKALLTGTIPVDETQLSFGYNQLDPGAVTAADIIGEYDILTGIYTGLQLIDQVFPVKSLIPGVINLPGWSHLPIVAAEMIAKTTNINGLFKCECLLDIDSSSEGALIFTDVAAWKQENNYINEHAIALWPKVKVSSKEYFMSALFGALIANTDHVNEDIPYVSPSNKPFKIEATIIDDGTEVFLQLPQANELNGVGVVTAINFNGWKSWGNNTSKYPLTVDPKDRFISVRRMFDWWGNQFINTYTQKVDDPLNLRLIESVVDAENIKANGFKARFQIADARIEFYQIENPTSNLMNGSIKFKQYLTPYTPAETIENELEFDPSALTSAIFGGAN
ncbi:MAG: phage tail protein [Tenericutes bacterium HGW-Tenericutes-1]|jgi:hypothetical protein|nr:MAG: phage tail protein [Tenericutes bacterium HGW-Tenericutes-1]PKM95806.1 MAG: phage tail protein [Firmicutes bacterium HGW-Firmicutes-1]